MRKTTNFGKEKWKSARSEEKPLIMGEKKWKSARFQKKPTNYEREKGEKEKHIIWLFKEKIRRNIRQMLKS